MPASARPSAPVRLSAAVLSAALLAGCAAGQDSAATSTEPTGTEPTGTEPTSAAATAPTTTSPAPSAAASPSPEPSPSVRTVEVAYAGGQVTGTSGREEVPVGERVVLRVSSDVAEEVHVHGYDLEQSVPAGGTAEIPVEATVPGVFEVELHDSGRLLFQLRVS